MINPIESDKANDSEKIDEAKLSGGKPLDTLYGISAFGHKFAVYLLKAQVKVDSTSDPNEFQMDTLILPGLEEQSNNASYVTSQGNCPEDWWKYDATTMEGKQVLDEVVALSQEAFLALTQSMFIPNVYP